MAPVRIRHPQGVATIELAFATATVRDLQRQIHAVAAIAPEHQDLRAGYPPKSLALDPDSPLASLGIKPGEQIIVSQAARATPVSPARPTPVSPARPTPVSPAQPTPVSPARPTPVSAPAPAPAARPQPAPAHVATDGGVLVLRPVPDDNSCLFSSVALVFEQDIARAPRLREVVASAILADPETYNDAILGMPPAQYTATIRRPTSWGGAIELGLLAAHYGTEIASVDVETGRVDRFAPPGAPSARAVLVYSGIHYDAAALAPSADAPPEWHQTVFPIAGAEPDPVLDAAARLAAVLRAERAYTNTATFDLRCEECGTGLKGEKGARAHAEATGHVRFGEY